MCHQVSAQAGVADFVARPGEAVDGVSSSPRRSGGVASLHLEVSSRQFFNTVMREDLSIVAQDEACLETVSNVPLITTLVVFAGVLCIAFVAAVICGLIYQKQW